jgi:hypothetical protein
VFDPRADDVGFMVDNMNIETDFLSALRFLPLIIISATDPYSLIILLSRFRGVTIDGVWIGE